MKKNFLFTAFIFAALSLGMLSCDNDEPDDLQSGEDSVTFTLTVLSSDAEKGEVTGSGVYNEGTEITITATPKPHYMFVEWSDGNTDNPRIVTINEDVTYTAVFAGAKGSENGYEWVDFGLPSGLKWATCNVGAIKPEESGNYYAWGETIPKDCYDWYHYKWITPGISNYLGVNKYTIADGQTSAVWYDSEGNFIGDNKTTLDSEDDAAAVNMGGSWRMPTKEEQQELIDKCTWTWTTLNGVNGYNVEGPNGNSIYIPVSGAYTGMDLGSPEVFGFCWSSSLDTDYSSAAYYISFVSGGVVCTSNFYRDFGRPVRGVIE